MALVHESLQGSEAQGRIDFAVYARDLARDILASQGGLHGKVRMKIELAKVMMSVDLAILCGLILNELIVNAFKHGFQNGVGGEIKLTMRLATDGECSLCVEDDGGGTPADINPKTAKSLGLRLVGSLTRQIRGSFELVKADRGTLACLRFKVLQ